MEQIQIQNAVAVAVELRYVSCICFILRFECMWICAPPHREEEDMELAAARRASMATRRQEERAATQERSAAKHSREERAEHKQNQTEPEEPRHRTGHINPASKPPGEKEKIPSG